MRTFSRGLVLAGALAVLAACAVRGRGTSAPPASSIELSPCAPAGVRAKCGTYEVYEEREARAGRKIPLNVVVLPALGPEPAPDPIFFLAGGPGEAATRALEFFAGPDWTEIRRRRDIVLVDQRGTGKSNPLTCELGGLNEAMRALYALDISEPVLRACLAELETRSDPRLYTTPIAMDDLDEVRAALGYRSINLYGGSYGTRAAFVFLRQHPDRVRAAVLRAIAPVDMKAVLPAARHGQRAFSGLVDACSREESCRSRYPHLKEDLAEVLARLAAKPVVAKTVHPRTKEPATIELTRDVFAGALTFLLASPGGTSAVPSVVRSAAAGDYEPFLAATVPVAVGAMSSWGIGMALTVICSEDARLIDPEEIPAATAGTFLGEGRVRNELRVCKTWPRGKLSAGFAEPVRSDVPVLMISGELDPIDGLDLARGAAPRFSKGLHVVIPGGTHQPQFPGCLLDVAGRFLAQGSGAGLDVSCVNAIQRSPFR